MSPSSFRFCTLLILVILKANQIICINSNIVIDDDFISILDDRSEPTFDGLKNVSIIEPSLPVEFLNENSPIEPPEGVKPRLLIVDIQNKRGNNFLHHQRDNINLGDIYTAVTPNLIFKIIDKKQVLWKAKGFSYPYKVFIGDEINNERQIQAYFLSKADVESDYPEPTQPEFEYTLLEIDIKVKTTDQYVIYNRNPETEREKFTCRPGYLIYKVYSGLRLMTKATNHKYFDRVVIYRDEFGNKNLQGLFPGQIDEGDLDEPLSPFISPDEYFPLFHSEVLDQENHLIYVNLKNKMSTKFITYEMDFANNVDIFVAREPYRFALVMNGNHRAWKYKRGEYPNQVFLFKDDKGSPFLRLGFPRAAIRFPKPKLFTLDVRNIESNGEYSYEYVAAKETQIFRPNPGYAIDRVMKGTFQIWKCEDFVYPEQVLIFPDKKGDPALRLQFPNKVTPESLPVIPGPEPEPLVELVQPSRSRETIKLPQSEAETTLKPVEPSRPNPRIRIAMPQSEPKLEPVTPKPEPRIRAQVTQLEPVLKTSTPEPRVRPAAPKPEPVLKTSTPEPRVRVLGTRHEPVSKRGRPEPIQIPDSEPESEPKSESEHEPVSKQVRPSKPEPIQIPESEPESESESEHESEPKSEPVQPSRSTETIRLSESEPESVLQPTKITIVDPRIRAAPPKTEPVLRSSKPRHKSKYRVVESGSELDDNFKYADLDIDSTSSTRSYDIGFFDGQVFGKFVFTAKWPYKFKQVFQSSCLIWRAKDLRDHAYKVIYDKENKTLLIFSCNGITRKLKYNKTLCGRFNLTWQCIWTNVFCGVFGCMFDSKDKWVESGLIFNKNDSVDYSKTIPWYQD